METDDRVEVPEGFLPMITEEDHPILEGIPSNWEGWFLSYNRLIPKLVFLFLLHLYLYIIF
jgi:uncharacterized membrane protein